MLCKICQSNTSNFARAIVLHQYEVDYFQCSHCGFVQTEAPYWLDAAYSKAIAHSDVGLVFRNNLFSAISSNLIFNCFNHHAMFLDYGGGYGLFVRLMRDLGYDFYWHDKYCQNLFSQGFEADLDHHSHYELVTAFEVFEHFVNPIEDIRTILQFSKNLLFSTTLLPPDNPKPEEWSYYSLHEGQHIGIYTPQALQILATRFGLNLYSNGSTLHLLTEKTIDPEKFTQLVQAQRADQRKPSLLEPDYYKVMNALLQERQGTSPTSSLAVIAFPDWQQPEDQLLTNLETAIRQVLYHPQNHRMVLYIYAGNTSPLSIEEAEMVLSSAVLQALMRDDLEIPDGLEISLIDAIDTTIGQQIQYQLPVGMENQAAIATLGLCHLPVLGETTG